VDNYATAFPDMHRELYNMYYNDDVVVVELSLNGTHKGDLEITEGVIPPTNKEMHAPTCHVFHLKNGKVRKGTVLSLLRCGADPSKQLGIFKNLSAAIRR